MMQSPGGLLAGQRVEWTEMGTGTVFISILNRYLAVIVTPGRPKTAGPGDWEKRKGKVRAWLLFLYVEWWSR